jgi:glycosyltransferase involved in cell wall biosynthesis
MPVNVLHLRDTDRICGPGKTILETARAATPGEFHHVIGLLLLTRETTNEYYAAARERGVPVAPLWASHQFDPRVLWRLLRAIREHDIHIVHSHDYKSDILAWAVSRFHRAATISTVHGWIWNNRRFRLYTRIAQTVLPQFDQVIAVSGETRNAVLQCGVTPGKVVTIHNGIVVQRYDPATVPAGTIRARYGIPPSARVVGYVGRLSPEKGQRDLLQAAAALAGSHPDVWYVFAGDGPDHADLERIVAETGLAGRTVFTGHLKDVRPIFQDIDLLALTSHTEGFPNVILEALCMGRPVLATDVGGVREIVEDGVTGLLLPAKQPDRIEAALRRLLDDPAAARRMAEAGRALVHREFDFQGRVRREEAVCRDLLARRAS